MAHIAERLQRKFSATTELLVANYGCVLAEFVRDESPGVRWAVYKFLKDTDDPSFSPDRIQFREGMKKLALEGAFRQVKTLAGPLESIHDPHARLTILAELFSVPPDTTSTPQPALDDLRGDWDSDK